MATAISRKSSTSPLHPAIEPMLATAGVMPVVRSQFAYEIKWDGIRAMIRVGGGSLEFSSRNGHDITARYPELTPLAKAVGRRQLVLDGEIISLGDDGRPNFPKLEHRMHLTGAVDIARMAASQPVFLVLFDLLQVGNRSLLDQPYTVRRKQLESLGLVSEHWQITPARVADGDAMLHLARERRLEGIVAKRLTSVYRPGRRSPDWIKIKLVNRQEFVIGGWVPEKGDEHRIGALLIGVHDDAGKLVYAGKTGTGLSSADHAPLLAKLRKLQTKTSPFADVLPKAHHVKPALVAEIEFRRWPAGALVHQSSFKGLRDDKKTSAVVREIAPTD